MKMTALGYDNRAVCGVLSWSVTFLVVSFNLQNLFHIPVLSAKTT